MQIPITKNSTGLATSARVPTRWSPNESAEPSAGTLLLLDEGNQPIGVVVIMANRGRRPRALTADVFEPLLYGDRCLNADPRLKANGSANNVLAESLLALGNEQVRRLPVVDERTQYVGVLSLYAVSEMYSETVLKSALELC